MREPSWARPLPEASTEDTDWGVRVNKDVAYPLASIPALEKMKDTQALPALQQISFSSLPEMVKQAAAKAVESIRK